VPFGYLFLSSPPKERIPLPDLRTLAGTEREKPSPEFIDILYDALRKQEWFREHLQEEDAEQLPFIGRYSIHDDHEAVARDIRHTLAIDTGARTATSWESFITELVRRAEGSQMLILRSSIVGNNTRRPLSVNEFRGFAISDRLAPLIFINSRDAKAAQIFTLAHELAHLWIGESGISNLDYFKRAERQRHEIDRYCDQVAAEVLVPSKDFAIRWNLHGSLEDNLRHLARTYKVSSFVILRRAFDHELIDQLTYRSKYGELKEGSKRARKKENGAFYPAFLARNSNTFTNAVVVAHAEGRINGTEAATLLNVKLGTLPNVERRVLGGEFPDA